MLMGFSHDLIVRIIENLVKSTPGSLNPCFYTKNGSSALEVTLKIFYHTQKDSGLEKPLFVLLTNYCHGKTIAVLLLYCKPLRKLLLLYKRALFKEQRTFSF